MLRNQAKLFVAKPKTPKAMKELSYCFVDLHKTVDELQINLLPVQSEFGDPLAVRARLEIAAKCIENAGDKELAMSLKQVLDK